MFFTLKITKNLLFFYLFFDYAAFLIVLTYSYGLFSQNLTLPSFILTKNSDTPPHLVYQFVENIPTLNSPFITSPIPVY